MCIYLHVVLAFLLFLSVVRGMLWRMFSVRVIYIQQLMISCGGVCFLMFLASVDSILCLVYIFMDASIDDPFSGILQIGNDLSQLAGPVILNHLLQVHQKRMLDVLWLRLLCYSRPEEEIY